MGLPEWLGGRARHKDERATMMRLAKRPRDSGLWLQLAESRNRRGDAIGEGMALLHASQAETMEPGWWVGGSTALAAMGFALEGILLDGCIAVAKQGAVSVWLPGWSLASAIASGRKDWTPLSLDLAETFHASQEALGDAWRAIAPPIGQEAVEALAGAAMRSLPWIEGERIERSSDGWLSLRP